MNNKEIYVNSFIKNILCATASKNHFSITDTNHLTISIYTGRQENGKTHISLGGITVVLDTNKHSKNRVIATINDYNNEVDVSNEEHDDTVFFNYGEYTFSIRVTDNNMYILITS